MNDQIPKWLRLTALLEVVGLVVLGLSLTARHPPMYLFTISVGSGCLLLGLLIFALKIRSGLKD